MLVGQLFAADITLGSISEKYLWRRNLIKIFNNFKYGIGDRVFVNAVIGKDGWLYYTGDMSIQDFQKTSPLNVGNIKRITQILNKFKEKTDQYNGLFLLVIPPDKSTVYPQYMPDEIPVIGQVSSLDRLVEYINKNSQVKVLDLRSAFESASKSKNIYYKTDSHWNCYGAFYAYDEILAELAISYPNIRHYPLSDFDIITSRDSLLDIPSLMGLNVNEDRMNAIPKFDNKIAVVPASNKNYKGASLKIVANTKGKSLPSLMIFHDSFYTACLNAFVEPTFSSTISLHYGDSQLTSYLDMIAVEEPDIVIVEFVERQMDFFYRHLSK
jgi:hypothetical protein